MGEASAIEPGSTIGWTWSHGAPVRQGISARSRLRRAAGVLSGGFVLAVIALVIGFFAFVATLARHEPGPNGRTDGIVVLTGGAQRIGEGVDLLAQGYGSRLLITGVNERTSRSEIARLNPGQRRLFECCVDLDYRARNTIGNAIETRRWVQDNRFRSLIVVTSNYHMPRTLLELDHVLPNVRKVPYAVTDPVDPVDWWRDAATARLLVSEYLKFLVVWARTRFESDPERSTAAKIMSRGQSPVKHVAAPLVN